MPHATDQSQTLFSSSTYAISNAEPTMVGTTGPVGPMALPSPMFGPPPTPPRTNSSDSNDGMSIQPAGGGGIERMAHTTGGSGGGITTVTRRLHTVRTYQRRSGSARGSAGLGVHVPGGASNSGESGRAAASQTAHRAAMIHAMMQQAARHAAVTSSQQHLQHQFQQQHQSQQQQQTQMTGRLHATIPTSQAPPSPSHTSSTSAPTHSSTSAVAPTSTTPRAPLRRYPHHHLPSATTPPAISRPTLVSGSGTVNPSVHPQFRSKAVCKLFCRHCTSIMCRRGMKAILLGNTKVELYSTDTPPTGVQLVYGDYLTQNCSCRIRDAACLGCGNVVGYHVTQPCEKCLEACNNGHFWMFLSDGVQPVERFDLSGAKLLRWASLPCAEQDRDEHERVDSYDMMCR